MLTLVLLILIGLAAGFSSGLFGLGGGIIIVPALVYLLGLSPHRATGTSLAVLLPPVGLAAVIEYYRHGDVDFKMAAVIAVMMLVGAWLGAGFAQKLSSSSMRMMFGVFLVVLGVYTIYRAANEASESGEKLANE